MASLFQSQTLLRHQYADILYSAITGTDASTANLVCTVQQAARLCYIFNSTGFDLQLFLVHPQADSTLAANRLKWMEMPANFNLNYDASAVNLEFDPGTKIYVAQSTGSASSGKLRIALWG